LSTNDIKIDEVYRIIVELIENKMPEIAKKLMFNLLELDPFYMDQYMYMIDSFTENTENTILYAYVNNYHDIITLIENYPAHFPISDRKELEIKCQIYKAINDEDVELFRQLYAEILNKRQSNELSINAFIYAINQNKLNIVKSIIRPPFDAKFIHSSTDIEDIFFNVKFTDEMFNLLNQIWFSKCHDFNKINKLFEMYNYNTNKMIELFESIKRSNEYSITEKQQLIDSLLKSGVETDDIVKVKYALESGANDFNSIDSVYNAVRLDSLCIDIEIYTLVKEAKAIYDAEQELAST